MMLAALITASVICFTGTIGNQSYSTVILVAITIKDHRLNPFRQRLLRHAGANEH